jgi:peptidoglycan/LPS O-acetylase OafA/YrhL
VPDFADDPSSELERKSKALAVMALVETFSYLVLFYFWVIAPNDVVRRIVGFLHGLVWLAFVAMVVLIRDGIGWTWAYTALVVLTGPIGGVLVFARIRRTPREVLVPPRPHVEGR